MSRKVVLPDKEKIEEYLSTEEDPTVKIRLMILSLIANLSGSYTLEQISDLTKIPAPTVKVWIRRWREEGYEGVKHPWLTTGEPVGRHPALDAPKLAYLKRRLEEKPHWTTKEVADLIGRIWGIQLSLSQVARILKTKLNMHFGKPYPHDFRRPADAEKQFRESLMSAYNRLFEKGLKAEDIALGFLDESSPQLTANTAKVWHFGRTTITKNTTRMKSNAIGFYAIQGHSVNDFLVDSTAESIQKFLAEVREHNNDYKGIIVVLDNFSSHKSKLVKAAARHNDIELVFLPPYSPDLNPIEFIWKSVKREISLHFIGSLHDLQKVISATWAESVRRCSYAKSWMEKFSKNNETYREICS